MIPLGERHLRLAIDEYVEHYHVERTHWGLGNQLIEGVPDTLAGPVQRCVLLGGYWIPTIEKPHNATDEYWHTTACLSLGMRSPE